MKEICTTIRVYEVGDVLDLSKMHTRLRAKTHFFEGKRALVVKAYPTKNGYSYKVINDEGYMFAITSHDTGETEVISHIDLDPLFSGIPGESVMDNQQGKESDQHG